MTDKNEPLDIEEIEITPASDLLQLSNEQLDGLIKRAAKVVERAQTAVFWLEGIKLEKMFRENNELTEIGGEE